LRAGFEERDLQCRVADSAVLADEVVEPTVA
jgi:hypothetical protein